MSSYAWASARRILAVRLDTIGDVLMTTPAIRALRGGGAEVSVLTSPDGAAVARLVPEIDDVIEYEAPWMKASAPGNDPSTDLAVAERLRDRRFDGAVIFTVYSQNPLPAAFLCRLAGIPLRLAHCRENPYQLLTDWVREPEPDRLSRHEVRRQLDLVATVGFPTADDRLSLRVPDRARRSVEDLLGSRGLHDGTPWIAVHPGATAPSRRYRAEGFAHAADRLAREHGIRILFTGDATEAHLVDSIRARMHSPSVSLAGRLGPAELAALIEAAPLLLSNNTGPVHIAAAVGTPVVVLYALTNPQHTPWRVPNRVLFHDVPCRWCYRSVCPQGHHDCLRLVEPNDVVAAVRDLLSETLAVRRDLARVGDAP